MSNLFARSAFLLLAISIALISCEKEVEPFAVGSDSQETLSGDSDFKLSGSCPPGFELTEDGNCKLRSIYQQYNSLENAGVGGLKTALPDYRDGFTPQQIDLGRYLFFDPILSGDGTVSCATCHQPEKGFADGLATSVGVGGQEVSRGAPSLWNVAFLKLFFWDGRATTLEEQMQGPLFAENEMATTPEKLISTLNGSEQYRSMFKQAFPNSDEKIELDEIYLALTAFEASLISLNSRYDQYAHGYHGALNEKEIEGMNIFRSFVARCAECHTPPLFTNQQLAVLGTPEPDGKALDAGAEIPYNDPTLRGAFKIPSLRNVAKTAPYMHSGKFKTLRETVEFYTKGRGHAVPEGENLYLHWHIWEPELTDAELDRLVDFLHTLTDESFMPKRPDRLPSGL
ncbi:MAG: cytochrome-c peroxidase [Flavobacteriales bacterium]|nr:cytochrome-c peroxidase [Flavobacteriales bacterium]MCB9190687.1 cytochrome-c peroxidase [Flavobacteriales bacterium]